MAEPLLPKDRIPWRHLVAFGWLPSSLKILAYRLFLGYRIGRGVRLSFGGVVVGDTVELGDFVEIGFLAIVQGRTIRIGRHSSIGTMSYVSCETIEIGEDAKIREQVYVGGPQLPESRFALGSRTIILQLSFINPTKPVVIGDDTGIGGHCLIFTHGVWLSALDGYPVNYEPVTLGKSVWLPWRVFVMPGTTIGDGTVIGADSLVHGTIPPYSLAVGSPAKVIRSAPDFPRPLSERPRSSPCSSAATGSVWRATGGGLKPSRSDRRSSAPAARTSGSGDAGRSPRTARAEIRSSPRAGSSFAGSSRTCVLAGRGFGRCSR